MMIVFAVILVLVAWWAIKAANRRDGDAVAGRPSETPLEALKRRYARGELTDEEFEEKKRRLSD